MFSFQAHYTIHIFGSSVTEIKIKLYGFSLLLFHVRVRTFDVYAQTYLILMVAVSDPTTLLNWLLKGAAGSNAKLTCSS